MKEILYNPSFTSLYNDTVIKWCEPEDGCPLLRECFNALSSLIFIILGVHRLYYFNKYNTPPIDSRNLYLLGLYINIGLCSFYYHGFLTSTGQILDEIGIGILMISTAREASVLIYLTPMQRHFIKSKILYLVVLCCVCLMIIAVPRLLGPFLLFIHSGPAAYLFYKIARPRKFRVAIILYICSVSLWTLERIMCTGIFVYFHALWHIGIALSVIGILDEVILASRGLIRKESRNLNINTGDMHYNCPL